MWEGICIDMEEGPREVGNDEHIFTNDGDDRDGQTIVIITLVGLDTARAKHKYDYCCNQSGQERLQSGVIRCCFHGMCSALQLGNSIVLSSCGIRPATVCSELTPAVPREGHLCSPLF